MVYPVQGAKKIWDAHEKTCAKCLGRLFIQEGKQKRRKGDPCQWEEIEFWKTEDEQNP